MYNDYDKKCNILILLEHFVTVYFCYFNVNILCAQHMRGDTLDY
jgi:hypothetical protein